MDVAAKPMAGWRVSPREEAREAFAALVERQGRLMFRVAMAVLRRAEDAEEAVQEAFLRMYRGSGWQTAREERAYVARVVWRVAVDRAAERQRRRGDEDVAEMELADGGAGAETAMGQDEDRLRLRRLIAGLPEELRQALVLCSIEEMGSREVGAVLGVPEGTVRRRVMRAKEELRRRFLAAAEREGRR